MIRIKKSPHPAANAAQRFGTHAEKRGQLPQRDQFEQAGTARQQRFVTLLRSRDVRLQQPFVNLGQHMLGDGAAQPLVCSVGPVEFFEPFARQRQHSAVAHRFDTHPRGGVVAHRDIVADELPGESVPDDMPLARFRGVHIAESALLDQSAAAVTDLLERKTAVLGDEEAFALPAEQLGKRREFSGRYVTVEIHRRQR